MLINVFSSMATLITPPFGLHPKVRDLPLLAQSRLGLSEQELDADALWDPHMGLYMTPGCPPALRQSTYHDHTYGGLGMTKAGTRFMPPVAGDPGLPATRPLTRPPRAAFTELYAPPPPAAAEQNRRTEEPPMFGGSEDYYFDLLRQEQELKDLRAATASEGDARYTLTNNTKTNAKKIGELALMQFSRRFEQPPEAEYNGQKKYNLQMLSTGWETANNAAPPIPDMAPNFSWDQNRANQAYLANTVYNPDVIDAGPAHYGVLDHQNQRVAYGNYHQMGTQGALYGPNKRLLQKLDRQLTRKPLLIANGDPTAPPINVRQARPRKNALAQATGASPNEFGSVRYGDLRGDAEDSAVLTFRQLPEPDPIQTQMPTSVEAPNHLLPQSLRAEMTLTSQLLPLVEQAETEGLLAQPEYLFTTLREATQSWLPREPVALPLLPQKDELPQASQLEQQELHRVDRQWAAAKNLSSVTMPPPTQIVTASHEGPLPEFRPLAIFSADEQTQRQLLQQQWLPLPTEPFILPLHDTTLSHYPTADAPGLKIQGLTLTQATKTHPLNLTPRADLPLRPLKLTDELTPAEKQKLQPHPTPLNHTLPLPPALERFAGFRENEVHELNPNPTSVTQSTAELQLQTRSAEDLLLRMMQRRAETEKEQVRLQKLASGHDHPTVTQDPLPPIQVMPENIAIDPAVADRRNQELQRLQQQGPLLKSSRPPTARFLEAQP